MFDISFSELALCFVVALVVLGPERLPKLARTLGLWSGKARSYMRNLTTELERETQLAEIKKQFQDAQQIMLESKASLENSTRALHDEVKQNLAPPGEAAAAAAATAVEAPAASAVEPLADQHHIEPDVKPEAAPEPPAVTAAPGATPATRAPLPPSEQQYP